MLLESEGGDGGDGGGGGDGGEGGEGGEGEGTTGSTASSHRRPEETPERLKRVVSMKNFEMLKVLGKGSYGKVILVRKTDGEDVGKKYTSHVRVLLPLSNVLIPLDCSLFWFSGSLSLCSLCPSVSLSLCSLCLSVSLSLCSLCLSVPSVRHVLRHESVEKTTRPSKKASGTHQDRTQRVGQVSEHASRYLTVHSTHIPSSLSASNTPSL